MIKYKLTKGSTSIDFPTLEAVAAFKQANPEWADIEAVSYEELPQPEKPAVPFEVKTWRMQAVLAIMGFEQQALALIEELPEPNRTVALKAWNGGSTTERSSATVAYLQQRLNLTDEQVDNIFIQADALIV